MRNIGLLFLVLLLVVATSFGAFAAGSDQTDSAKGPVGNPLLTPKASESKEAKEPVKQQPPTNITFEFVSNQRLIRDGRVPAAAAASINNNVTVTLEEGYTLTVYGQFTVNGTFINKGTVKVVSPTKDRGLPGGFTNRGTFINEGNLLINNGSVRNHADGTLKNSGLIQITGNNPDLTYLLNAAVGSADGKAKPALLENSGVIRIANADGMGFDNSGTLNNTGWIDAYEGATHKKVTIEDKRPVVAPEPEAPAVEQATPQTPAASTPPPATPPATNTPVTPPTTTTPPASSTSPQQDTKSAKDAFNRFVKGGNGEKV